MLETLRRKVDLLEDTAAYEALEQLRKHSSMVVLTSRGHIVAWLRPGVDPAMFENRSVRLLEAKRLRNHYTLAKYEARLH